MSVKVKRHKYQSSDMCKPTDAPTAITLDDWLTSSNKYPDRAKSLELTPEITANAKKLLEAVNALFKELGLEKPVVSSGFRPSKINTQVKGAKASGHLRGMAVDLVDVDGSLATVIAANPARLRHHGLMIENPRVTVTADGKSRWLHIDTVNRVDRPSRMFTP